jgi:transcriptional regulator with XRE-family HTH domain
MFAELLRRQREAAGLTQAELAARAGLGERTVSTSSAESTGPRTRTRFGCCPMRSACPPPRAPN